MANFLTEVEPGFTDLICETASAKWWPPNGPNLSEGESSDAQSGPNHE
jgi:hypothetical protein